MSKKKKNNTSPESRPEEKGNQQAKQSTDNQRDTDVGGDKIEVKEPLTAEEEINIEEQLRKEIEGLNDKYLRLFAEFENYRRRKEKERAELINTASKSVLLTLLPVLDDMDRAQKSMESADNVEAVKEGVNLIHTKFKKVLDQQGLKEMETVGHPFDSELHEAVTNIPAPSEDMKGKVVDQVEKGYYLNEKVIRFAKVIVGA